MVRGMVMQYGMSDVLGPVAYGESQNHQVFLGRDFHQERNYSEEVASEIDKEVRKYLEDAYEACRKIITENRDKLELIAQALMERETLTAKQLEELLETGKLSEDETKEPPKDDDNGPKDGDPALIPPTTLAQQAQNDAIDAEVNKEKEVVPVGGVADNGSEPKFNVTHYNK